MPFDPNKVVIYPRDIQLGDVFRHAPYGEVENEKEYVAVKISHNQGIVQAVYGYERNARSEQTYYFDPLHIALTGEREHILTKSTIMSAYLSPREKQKIRDLAAGMGKDDWDFLKMVIDKGVEFYDQSQHVAVRAAYKTKDGKERWQYSFHHKRGKRLMSRKSIESDVRSGIHDSERDSSGESQVKPGSIRIINMFFSKGGD